MNTLIKEVYQAVHNTRSDAVFGISPQGNINNNDALGADVRKWCKEDGYIDYICPQIYFSLDNPALGFEDCLDQWKSIKKHSGLRFYTGLAGYKAGSDADDGTWLDNDDILLTEVKICKESGADGFMLYSYDSLFNDESTEEVRNVMNYLTSSPVQ